jgi:tRNA dimethylallyltransferase
VPELIVIAGATASGKSACAVALARALQGEVVSCDSMQIYRGMDIGTATPGEEEMQGVPHHLLSVLEPGDPCSASIYRDMALPVIRDIEARGRTPILCGGTGLYIDALTRPMGFAAQGDGALREKLRRMEPGALHRRLTEVDPESGARLHPNDVRRVIRALEVYELTGKPLSLHREEDARRPGDYEGVLFALDHPREALYERINRRVDEMLKAGLEQEVRGLMAEGLARGCTALQAIGYKEMALYIEGASTLEEAREAIAQATRRYAKRQLTWLRRDERVYHLDAPGKSAEGLAKEILQILGGRREKRDHAKEQ